MATGPATLPPPGGATGSASAAVTSRGPGFTGSMTGGASGCTDYPPRCGRLGYRLPAASGQFSGGVPKSQTEHLVSRPGKK
eukprot:3240674-Amphidinium_carterae.1